MKKLYSTVIVILSVIFTFANPVNTALGNNNNWKDAASWSLNRKPQGGDTIVIPAGVTLIIDNNQDLHSQFLYVEIYGTLEINTGTRLKLNSASSIIVYTTGTINANSVTKLKGSDADVSGPKLANNTTSSSPNGFDFFTPLPVKFIGFNVARQNNNVLVQWATAEEINSSYFEVQRSENGNDWNTITTITAAGNTTLTRSYSYTDRNVTAKVVYYRVRQVDIDGRFTITPVRMIKNETGNTEIKISATSSNSVYLHFSEQVKANVVVRLISTNGQVVSQKTFDEPVGQVMMPVQNALKGIYVVNITDGQDLKF